MKTAIITGAAGLVGGEAVSFFSEKGFRVVGIDNNMREYFFGPDGSTEWNRKRLEEENPGYIHFSCDIRSAEKMREVFNRFGRETALIVHAAAQPSHDWAAGDPSTDFSVNADGTLVLLEMFREWAPQAVFIYTSTNKVYGDTPNRLPLVETEKRWEPEKEHPYYEHGIDEEMSIDRSVHSLFGVSKTAADLLVQEYGKNFGLRTASFRGGCLTGPRHSGARLHGFLSYLVKCLVEGKEYTVQGYKGKQVRDNIHSRDLVSAFYHFYGDPKPGEVYNIGGGRANSCSVLEAIEKCEKISGRKLSWRYSEESRKGDHIWWISDVRKFRRDYPEWGYEYGLDDILREIIETETGKKEDR